MRDFYFFTNKKITAKDCFESLKKEIKNVEMNGDSDIWINAKSRSFLWLCNDELSEFIVEDLQELQNKIPIENPYVNDFQTHRSIDAKRVIKVLMQIYPELYINVDDPTDWYGTAQEYLDAEFDY